MESIVLRSYNCQSFRRNIDFIRDLLRDCDVLFLQETILPQHSFSIADLLSDRDQQFEYSFVSSTRDDADFSGRSSGGLACIWKKQLTPFIEIVPATDRIHGLSLRNMEESILLLNIYAPCDYRNNESRQLFQSTMADLTNVCIEKSNQYDHIIIAGDWNADPSKGRFFAEMTDFVDALSMHIVDVMSLPLTSHTYVSCNESCSTSWIDHVVSTSMDKVKNVKILYGETFHDHLPIEFECTFNVLLRNDVVNDNSNDFHRFIPWKQVGNVDLVLYAEYLDELSKGIDANFCTRDNCNIEEHKLKLKNLYDCLIECIYRASDNLYVMSNLGKTYKKIPGWNNHCRELHSVARQNYLVWVQNDKPRFGPVFEDMKLSRSNFKRALNFCKNNETQICKQNLANVFLNKDKCNYWKEIKKQNGCNNIKVVNKIDNETDKNKIVDIFKNKYKDILNDANSQMSPELYDETVQNLYHREQIAKCVIFNHIMDKSIDNLKVCSGWDGIHSNHLKFSNKAFRVILCKLFSAFLCHGYIPNSMLRGEIRPIIKNPLGNKMSSDNYRPVMNSSNMFKLFEYCILPHLNHNLKINPRQFAYRPEVGCMTSGVILNETVKCYNAKNSNVHCLLIDYSKAYDRVNYKILLCKLIDSNLPRDIIRILKCIFENSYIGIRFQGVCSESDFKSGNGVRQGGVSSGLLFTFYINEILRVICEMNIGCSIVNYRVNVLGYADDLSLFAPTRKGLQILIDVVINLSNKLCLTINARKTQYIVFIYDRRLRNLDYHVSIDDENIERVFTCKYLGVCLNDDLSLDSDVNKCCKVFLGQFNSMYYKFNFVNTDQLLYLFNSYCMSFYGLELWSGGLHRLRMFDSISISYHKALKRIVGLSPYHNNHDAAAMSGSLLFKHLLASRIVSFLFKLVFNSSPCMMYLKNYFRNDSFMYKNIRLYFSMNYNIDFLYENNLCALKSRIKFVQRNEPSSGYIPVVNM